jgi:hypothetical protein
MGEKAKRNRDPEAVPPDPQQVASMGSTELLDLYAGNVGHEAWTTGPEQARAAEALVAVTRAELLRRLAARK